MNHYVYKIIDPITNEYYIGSRSCECDVDDDIYMGSYKTWKPIDKTRLVKTILKSDFDNRDSALIYEKIIIQENINDEFNRNYHIPGDGFATVGFVTVCDGDGNVFNIRKNDNRYILGEVKPIWHGRKHTEESKQKMSVAKKGKEAWNKGKTNVYTVETIEKMRKSAIKRKPIDENTRKKISLSNKGKLVGDKNPMYGMIGSKNPNYGNKWTEEQKRMQSERLKGKTRSKDVNNKTKKPILQYDLYGNFVNEWESLSAAANSLNILVGCINNCLKGRSKSSYGFVWKYKNII